jgi:hypothetical protein
MTQLKKKARAAEKGGGESLVFLSDFLTCKGLL